MFASSIENGSMDFDRSSDILWKHARPAFHANRNDWQASGAAERRSRLRLAWDIDLTMELRKRLTEIHGPDVIKPC